MPIKLPSLPNPAKIALPRKLPSLPKWPVPATASQATPPKATTHDVPSAVTRGSVWRDLTKPVRAINWRIITAAIFGIGILHIIATLAAPSLAIATAFNRLEGVLPSNRMVVLPQVAPGTQPLPFLSPALRYAMCRFDTKIGPVDLTVELSESGSSLTIYSVDGEAIYTAAQSDVPMHRVRIVPADGRFLGLTPEARGLQSTEIPSANLTADRGIVVFAIPDRGVSYQAMVERQLSGATCNSLTERT